MTRQRKYLIGCGLALVILALIYRFYPADLTILNIRSGIELKQKRITKYRRVVHEKEKIQDHLDHLKNVFNRLAGTCLAGTTPALAAVDIQNIINQIAQKVGVKIDRVDIKKEKKIEGGNIVSIPVRFSLTTTTRQLRDFLYGIESSSKILRVVDLNSSVKKMAHPEQISSNITIEGFFLE